MRRTEGGYLNTEFWGDIRDFRDDGDFGDDRDLGDGWDFGKKWLYLRGIRKKWRYEKDYWDYRGGFVVLDGGMGADLEIERNDDGEVG